MYFGAFSLGEHVQQVLVGIANYTQYTATELKGPERLLKSAGDRRTKQALVVYFAEFSSRAAKEGYLRIETHLAL